MEDIEDFDDVAARLAGNRKSIDDLEENRRRKGPQWVAEKLLPRDRRCPRCQLIKVERMRWVVDGGRAICRSCSRFRKTHREWSASDVFVVVRRWRVNWRTLKDSMIEKGLTGRFVASSCGWSTAKQSRIENGTVTELDEREARVLQDVVGLELEELGHLYLARGLRELRTALGVSPRDFSRKCGWDLSRQRRIESGAVAVNSTQAAAIIKAARELS